MGVLNDKATALQTSLDDALESSGVNPYLRDDIEEAIRAMHEADAKKPMNLWRVNAAIPGLNVPFFIYSPERPTHEQINEVWMRTSETPLKSPKEAASLPLRDAYPSYVSVEMVPVSHLETGS